MSMSFLYPESSHWKANLLMQPATRPPWRKWFVSEIPASIPPEHVFYEESRSLKLTISKNQLSQENIPKNTSKSSLLETFQGMIFQKKLHFTHFPANPTQVPQAFLRCCCRRLAKRPLGITEPRALTKIGGVMRCFDLRSTKHELSKLVFTKEKVPIGVPKL